MTKQHNIVKSKLRQTLELLPGLPAGPCAFFLLKYLYNEPTLPGLMAKCVPDNWLFQSKIVYLSQMMVLVAIFYAIVTILIILGRGISSSLNPLEKKDSEIILFFNRIMTNSIEQTLIFFPILIYWTLNICQEENKHLALVFTKLWVFGRLIFILGYSLYYITGMGSFRAYGFSLNMAISIILILMSLGYHPLEL